MEHPELVRAWIDIGTRIDKKLNNKDFIIAFRVNQIIMEHAGACRTFWKCLGDTFPSPFFFLIFFALA